MTAAADADLIPARRPPASETGALGWARHNLFSGWLNTIITIVAAFVAYKVIWGALSYTVFNAVWTGTPQTCQDMLGKGACWLAIQDRYRFILFGPFDYDQQWRGALVIFLFVAMVGLSAIRRFWGKKLIYGWGAALAVVLWLMYGGLGLKVVETSKWGGLPLTLLLAFAGIIFAFPLGIVLALGRRSHMPAIKALCVAYIELIRGVPLISVLFMASVMFPLFLPENITIDKVLRAQVGIILFTAAYTAEAIRGGLQAVPKGQYEAADALGLGYWRKMSLIVLPQALKISIPSIVNNFISTLKDTSLVTIIALYDLLNTSKIAFNEPQWRSFFFDGFIVAGLIFFVFCFSISRISIKIERVLDVGHKRR